MLLQVAVVVALISLTTTRQVPFNRSILYKRYKRREPCGSKIATEQSIVATEETIDYYARFYGAGTIEENVCQTRISLRFTTRTRHPYVEKLLFDRHEGEFCARTQRIERYWPWGKRRSKFIKHIRIIMAGAISIRDSKCSMAQEIDFGEDKNARKATRSDDTSVTINLLPRMVNSHHEKEPPLTIERKLREELNVESSDEETLPHVHRNQKITLAEYNAMLGAHIDYDDGEAHAKPHAMTFMSTPEVPELLKHIRPGYRDDHSYDRDGDQNIDEDIFIDKSPPPNENTDEKPIEQPSTTPSPSSSTIELPRETSSASPSVSTSITPSAFGIISESPSQRPYSGATPLNGSIRPNSSAILTPRATLGSSMSVNPSSRVSVSPSPSQSTEPSASSTPRTTSRISPSSFPSASPSAIIRPSTSPNKIATSNENSSVERQATRRKASAIIQVALEHNQAPPKITMKPSYNVSSTGDVLNDMDRIIGYLLSVGFDFLFDSDYVDADILREI